MSNELKYPRTMFVIGDIDPQSQKSYFVEVVHACPIAHGPERIGVEYPIEMPIKEAMDQLEGKWHGQDDYKIISQCKSISHRALIGGVYELYCEDHYLDPELKEPPWEYDPVPFDKRSPDEEYCSDCGCELNEDTNHSAGECNICHEKNKDD